MLHSSTCHAQHTFLHTVVRIFFFWRNNKAAVAGRAKQDTTRAPVLRVATLWSQEAAKSSEMGMGLEGTCCCPPSVLCTHVDAASPPLPEVQVPHENSFQEDFFQRLAKQLGQRATGIIMLSLFLNFWFKDTTGEDNSNKLLTCLMINKWVSWKTNPPR